MPSRKFTRAPIRPAAHLRRPMAARASSSTRRRLLRLAPARRSSPRPTTRARRTTAGSACLRPWMAAASGGKIPCGWPSGASSGRSGRHSSSTRRRGTRRDSRRPRRRPPRRSCARGRVIAADHRQPAQLEQGRGGQGMVELAAGHDRALQGERRPAPRGPPRPGPRPARRRPTPPTSGWAGPTRPPRLPHQLVEQRIVGGQRPQQLRPPPDGQRRAADDLLRRRWAAASAPARCRRVGNCWLMSICPWRNHHRTAGRRPARPPRARAPGDGLPPHRGPRRPNRRKLHAEHPVGKGDASCTAKV